MAKVQELEKKATVNRSIVTRRSSTCGKEKVTGVKPLQIGGTTRSLSHRRASLVPTIVVSAPEEDEEDEDEDEEYEEVEEKQKGKGKKVEFQVHCFVNYCADTN